eukprot:CAMPEP_0197909990 /NCGR_PEP_ID=MMETSP1439-20131203/70043_1 /TAXON_ID=66791 /ORGANISM="Gonyaulax spinifera, Strain CCMP409" /LENGTH=55 /DNA_ID=CAMNT_0043531607 /DNA_START=1 /DNA_END=165 /DNA_ORIENTATION=+
MDAPLKSYEGIYCPASRDSSGRATFQQVHAFKPGQSLTGKIAFNRDAYKWCLNDA